MPPRVIVSLVTRGYHKEPRGSILTWAWAWAWAGPGRAGPSLGSRTRGGFGAIKTLAIAGGPLLVFPLTVFRPAAIPPPSLSLSLASPRAALCGHGVEEAEDPARGRAADGG